MNDSDIDSLKTVDVFGVAALVAVLALMWSIGSAEAGNVELADAPVPSAVSLDPGTLAQPGLEPGQPAPARFWQDSWLRPGHATPQLFHWFGVALGCLGGSLFHEQDSGTGDRIIGCTLALGW